MKKKILTITIVPIILIASFIIIIKLNKTTDIKEENINKITDTKEENINKISYVCTKIQQQMENILIENIYKFDVKDSEILNAEQQTIFTFDSEESYNNIKINNSNLKTQPDRIENDDDNLKTIFIWYNKLEKEKNMTIEDYLKLIETYEYVCAQSN